MHVMLTLLERQEGAIACCVLDKWDINHPCSFQRQTCSGWCSLPFYIVHTKSAGNPGSPAQLSSSRWGRQLQGHGPPGYTVAGAPLAGPKPAVTLGLQPHELNR